MDAEGEDVDIHPEIFASILSTKPCKGNGRLLTAIADVVVDPFRLANMALDLSKCGDKTQLPGRGAREEMSSHHKQIIKGKILTSMFHFPINRILLSSVWNL